MGGIKAALLPDCRDAARIQSDQMERRLPAAKRAGLFMHLLMCKWCRRYGRQIRFMRTAVREHPEKLAEADVRSLSSEARERIKSRVAKEKEQG